MKLSNEDVQEILRLLDGTPYTELHLETADLKLSLRRTGKEWTASQEIRSPANVVQAAPSAPPAAEPTAAPEGRREGLIDVLSPLPGTIYRAPQPGAPPFVEVGSQVEEDTVVCIVETMKLMNSIPAGVRGRIAEICVENAEPVDKDAVIMRIDPS